MRRAFARMVCGLAAWALTAGHSLIAQAPSPLPIASTPSPTASGPIEDFGAWTAAHVQLAWMADPIIFRLNLGARVNPDALIVYGFVPTEPMRQHVLQVARDASGMNVIDGLRLHPNLETGYVPSI